MSTSDLGREILGHTVVDARGERIGELASLYRDVDTGAVTFGGVSMLRRGRRRVVLVCLTDAVVRTDTLTVKCGKDLARRAPSVRPGESLPVDREPALYAHYDLGYDARHRAESRLAPVE